ncbi:MAG: type IX secretion system membrane protein PorP/SprF [Bacteroidia bacterium]|nr:type IX secretion system membrane protein PorP/SprF [Bacteroidia bacterium]
MSQKKYFYTVLMFVSILCLQAQDMQFSQYYSAPLFINPALTGASVCHRLSSNIRTQWPGTGKGYVSEVVSYDHFDINHSIGYGAMITNDQAGTGNLRTTGLTGSFAYEATINRRFAFRAGAQAGFFQRSVNMSKLLFGDQIARGGSDVSSFEIPNPSVTYPDFNVGALGYSKDYWIGLAVHHLFKPEESLLGSTAGLPRKISVQAGKRFYLTGGEDKPGDHDAWIVMPTFNYRHQAKFDQLDIGCYFSRSVVTFGLWYRGIPILKGYKPGYPNNDALVFLVGMSADRLHIGYSYDVTISWLTMKSRGAHELSISYQACTLKPKKKRSPIVSCPKF